MLVELFYKGNLSGLTFKESYTKIKIYMVKLRVTVCSKVTPETCWVEKVRQWSKLKIEKSCILGFGL